MMIYSAILLAGEGILDWLQNVDRSALLAVNGSDSLFLDSVVHVLTTAITWLPLYLSLFYLVVKNHNSLQRIALIVGCAGLCILFAAFFPPMRATRLASPSSSVGWYVVGFSVSPLSFGRL